MAIHRDELLQLLDNACRTAQCSVSGTKEFRQPVEHADGAEQVLIIGGRERMKGESSPIISLIEKWLDLNSGRRDLLSKAAWNAAKEFLNQQSGDMVAASLLPRPRSTVAAATADGLKAFDEGDPTEDVTQLRRVQFDFGLPAAPFHMDLSKLPFAKTHNGTQALESLSVTRMAVDPQTEQPMWGIVQELVGAKAASNIAAKPQNGEYLPSMEVHYQNGQPQYLNHVTLAILSFQAPTSRNLAFTDAFAYEFSIDRSWSLDQINNVTFGAAYSSNWFRLSPLLFAQSA